MIENKKNTEIEFDELNEPKHAGHVHGPGCNHHHHALRPIERTEPKIGRNDPCTCGSGKKFKKCCG